MTASISPMQAIRADVSAKLIESGLFAVVKPIAFLMLINEQLPQVQYPAAFHAIIGRTLVNETGEAGDSILYQNVEVVVAVLANSSGMELGDAQPAAEWLEWQGGKMFRNF